MAKSVSNAGHGSVRELAKILMGADFQQEIREEVSAQTTAGFESGLEDAVEKISKTAPTQADQISSILTKAITKSISNPNKPIDLSELIKFDVGKKSVANLEKKIAEQVPDLNAIISAAMLRGSSGNRTGNRASIETIISKIDIPKTQIAKLTKSFTDLGIPNSSELQQTVKLLSQYVAYINDLEKKLTPMGVKRKSSDDLYLPTGPDGKFSRATPKINIPFDVKGIEEATATLYNFQRAWDALKDTIDKKPLGIDSKTLSQIMGFRSEVSKIANSVDVMWGEKGRTESSRDKGVSPVLDSMRKSAILSAYSSTIRTPLRRNGSGLSDNWNKVTTEIESRKAEIEELKAMSRRDIETILKSMQEDDKELLRPLEELRAELDKLYIQYNGQRVVGKYPTQSLAKALRENFAKLYGSYVSGGGKPSDELTNMANELFLSEGTKGLVDERAPQQQTIRQELKTIYDEAFRLSDELRKKREEELKDMQSIGEQLQEQAKAEEESAERRAAAEEKVIRIKKESLKTTQELHKAVNNPIRGLTGGKYIAGVDDNGNFTSPIKTGKIT